MVEGGGGGGGCGGVRGWAIFTKRSIINALHF